MLLLRQKERRNLSSPWEVVKIKRTRKRKKWRKRRSMWAFEWLRLTLTQMVGEVKGAETGVTLEEDVETNEMVVAEDVETDEMVVAEGVEERVVEVAEALAPRNHRA